MWTDNNNSLYTKMEFNNFVDAFAFLTKVAIVSEKMNHHATIKNTYGTVELWLSTHDANNQITEKDHLLANAIDKLV